VAGWLGGWLGLDFFGPLWDGLRGFEGGEHGFDLRRLQLRRV